MTRTEADRNALLNGKFMEFASRRMNVRAELLCMCHGSNLVLAFRRNNPNMREHAAGRCLECRTAMVF